MTGGFFCCCDVGIDHYSLARGLREKDYQFDGRLRTHLSGGLRDACRLMNAGANIRQDFSMEREGLIEPEKEL